MRPKATNSEGASRFQTRETPFSVRRQGADAARDASVQVGRRSNRFGWIWEFTMNMIWAKDLYLSEHPGIASTLCPDLRLQDKSKEMDGEM